MIPKCPHCGRAEHVTWTQEEVQIVTYAIKACEADRLTLDGGSYRDDPNSEAIEGTGLFHGESCAHSWRPERAPSEVGYE